ncbi:MAG: cellulase family glycosylhydrolase [Melioribacteraceae bacterium]|jgi:aryl-phospho-beta-D-glucosidase BglC (GH1 family)|nr:cellulase family glycosylhydrolase [Melioribacteraceae bacterium]
MPRILNLVFLLIISSITIFSQSKEFARAHGKIILDANGKEILFRGTNLGNWLNPEGYMFHFKDVNSFRLIDELFKELVGADETRLFWKKFRDNYITRNDILYLKKLDFNHLRVPFNFKLFVLEDHPEIFIEEGFKRLDDVINWCEEADLYVILDLHAAPGGQTGDNIDDSWGYPYLMENETARQTTILLWKKIAERYKDKKIILGYDLLNEPIAHFFENKEKLNLELEPLYKRIVSAIREVDKNHIIFLGGAQWNTNFDVFGEPFDENLVYTFHKYWMPPVQDEIQAYINFREKYNVPIWMGESGENEDKWIESFRILLENNNIGWSFWPYKKMDSTRGIVSFPKTEEWDAVIKYAESSRKNFEEIRKNKPSRETVLKALDALLYNILFKNCSINYGYLNSLGIK